MLFTYNTSPQNIIQLFFKACLNSTQWLAVVIVIIHSIQLTVAGWNGQSGPLVLCPADLDFHREIEQRSKHSMVD